ncbi:MAG: hypothetical protein LE168_05620, partial [Endomicrobium sp.]|nr:hypothetical protein [Endomicrobium sp.]
MFEGKSFIEILNMGGWSLYVLFAASAQSTFLSAETQSIKEGKTVLLHMPLLYFAFQPKEKSIAPSRLRRCRWIQ